MKPTTSVESSSTLGKNTDHPDSTSAPTALTTGDRESPINEGNFLFDEILKKLFWSVLSHCLLCSSSGMFVMAEVKQMQPKNVNTTSLKSAEKQSWK